MTSEEAQQLAATGQNLVGLRGACWLGKGWEYYKVKVLMDGSNIGSIQLRVDGCKKVEYYGTYMVPIYGWVKVENMTDMVQVVNMTYSYSNKVMTESDGVFYIAPRWMVESS